MHQYPRGPPATASPASSPRTNPTRTNNPRNQDQGPASSGSDLGAMGERSSTEGLDVGLQSQQSNSQGKEAKAKLAQIIQNFHTKAALIILQSRVPLPPAYSRGSETKRVNKWFNVELDETDALRDDLRPWKTCDAFEKRPPPLMIETFVDTAELTNNQSLVIIDDQGKAWDVLEALNASGGSRRMKQTQVILERWKIELGESTAASPADLGSQLPTIYKKSIVLFRSLFTYSKFLPAWKFAKRTSKWRSHPSFLAVNYRILNGAHIQTPTTGDTLFTPLTEAGGRPVETFSFGATDSPAGPFSVQVSYRTNCEFRVDDSEALLSSHFMGMDEQFFKPSLAGPGNRELGYFKGIKEVGSLPPQRSDRADRPDRSQAYGSLSTFHQIEPRASSSPLSALRAARELNAPSPSESPPQKMLPMRPSAQGSRSSLRSTEGAPGMQRRPSVSFSPFKAPSLSASPSRADPSQPASPRTSISRASNLSALAEARNPSPLGPQSPSSPRTSSSPRDNAVTSSVSSSPKPALVTRYSSSFGHRRARLSSGAGSKTEDDNNSSGKASVTSLAAQPGSGMLAEGGGGSSGSVQTDDDNISDFLKLLDTKKDLKSFQAPNDSASVDASTRRTTAALSKFQRMRDSNAALSDSMSSSMLLHRSSTSSSRQLSSVPPMIAGTSISTSSSPGKPISPHTPHTPAIPSRLSANSIAEYPHRSRRGDRHRLFTEDNEEQLEEVANESTTHDVGTNAIDIPTSPRPYHPSYRRSSSVAQQHRVLPIEDEIGDMLPFGMRSASLGADDRPPLSLSALLALQDGLDMVMQPIDSPERAYNTLPPSNDGAADSSRQRSPAPENREDSPPPAPRNATAGSLNSPYRHRLSRGGGGGGGSGRGYTPPHGSFSSLAGDRGSGSGSSDQRGGRYSFTRPGSNFEEEEPFLFAMSDFGAGQSRRSLEEGRGGFSAVANERGAGAGAGADSASSRGSRRGAPLRPWS